MAGFDAGTVVEPLDYAFDSCNGKHEGSCWRGSEAEPRPAKCTVFVPGCHGAVAEPTDRQIAAYLSGIKKLVRDFRGKLPDEMIAGSTDVAAMLSAVEDLDEDLTLKFNDGMAEIFAALCSGDPSKDDMLALPPRVRAMFFRWVQTEVMSPEAAPGGGKAQVKNLRSVAAG